MTIGMGERGVGNGVANDDMANNVSHAFGVRDGNKTGETARSKWKVKRGEWRVFGTGFLLPPITRG
jgi:hypothetical protein